MPFLTSMVWPNWLGAATSSIPWDNWVGALALTPLSSVRPVGIATTTSLDATTVVWNSWNNTATITSTSTYPVWLQWTSTEGLQRVNPPVQRVNPPVDLAVQAAAERRRQALAEESRRKLQAAEERAEVLLRSILSEQQNQDLTAHGYFFVDAPSGRRYRVDKTRSSNLKVIDRVTGVWVESLCIHQRESIPVFDQMCMQKLLIETAEEAMREVANITRKDGGWSNGRGVLDNQKLRNVIPFPRCEEQKAA